MSENRTFKFPVDIQVRRHDESPAESPQVVAKHQANNETALKRIAFQLHKRYVDSIYSITVDGQPV